jgi:hypothetical protein
MLLARRTLASVALLAVLGAVVVLPCACGRKGTASSSMGAQELKGKMQESQAKAYSARKGR